MGNTDFPNTCILSSEFSSVGTRTFSRVGLQKKEIEAESVDRFSRIPEILAPSPGLNLGSKYLLSLPEFTPKKEVWIPGGVLGDREFLGKEYYESNPQALNPYAQNVPDAWLL